MHKDRILTKEKELQILRSFFSELYMYRNITMDVPVIHHMLSYVDKLGRAHTVGNGMADNDALVRGVLMQMDKSPWQKSSYRSGVETKFKAEYRKSVKNWNRKQKALERKRQKKLAQLTDIKTK